MIAQHAVAAHWSGGFDEAGLEEWARDLRRQLDAPRVSLGLVFMSPRFFQHAAQVLEILRVHAQIPLLAGCSGIGLIAGQEEVEQNAGLVLGLYYLPGAKLKAFHFAQGQIEEFNGPGYWHAETGIEPDKTRGWLAFVDPFHLDSEAWLRGWNEAYAPLPVFGGLASGRPNEPATQVYLNGEVFDHGGVAISVGGDVGLVGLVSQGCTPIGETWTLTSVERNLIHRIANRRAYDVLAETVNALPAEEKRKVQSNLFIGLVANEYMDEFRRGDFLIRNLLGAEPITGVIAVGAFPRPGQTIQFQRRDAQAATEDMIELLTRTRRRLENTQVYGGCLCCCCGRGRSMFGTPHHDTRLVQKHLGPLGLAGFFCNGEIGPVGDKSYLHGYAASLALFVKC